MQERDDDCDLIRSILNNIPNGLPRVDLYITSPGWLPTPPLSNITNQWSNFILENCWRKLVIRVGYKRVVHLKLPPREQKPEEEDETVNSRGKKD